MLSLLWFRYWPFVVLIFSVAAVFFRTVGGGYLAWDTAVTFAQNPAVLHLFNILIHILNTFLVYILAKKLLLIRNKDAVELGELGRQAFALIAALIFAVHPLQVEPVASLMLRRDLVAAFFALSAVLVAWDTSDRLFPTWAAFGRRLIATGLFALTLFLNPALAALPVGIKWLSHFTERRGLKWPMMWLWLAMGAGASGVAYGINRKFIELHLPHMSLSDRLTIAGDSLGFYVKRFFELADFSADYGRTPHAVLSGSSLLPDWPVLVVFLAVAVALAFILPRAVWGGLGFFIFMLIPVSGVVGFAAQVDSTVADHYMYLPVFGFGFAFAVLIAESKTHLYARTFIVYLLIGYLGFKSYQQSLTWLNNRPLFESILKVNPASAKAWLFLAKTAREENDLTRARDYLSRAREIRPQSAAVLSEAADIEWADGRREAVLQFRAYVTNAEFLRRNSHDPASLERLKKRIEEAEAGP